ncbi:ATP-binding protein [Caballeronia sp. HLA56]
MSFRPPDTIAWRIALTVGSAIIGVLTLSIAANELGGFWASPAALENALLGRVDDIVRLIDAAPSSYRDTLAASLRVPKVSANWYPAKTVIARDLAVAATTRKIDLDDKIVGTDGHPRAIVRFNSADGLSGHLPYQRIAQQKVDFFAVQLSDDSWLVFTDEGRQWALPQPAQIAIALGVVGISILAASVLATYFLSKPIRWFANELRRLGSDPRASAIPEVGPKELRSAISAFNVLQARLRQFVEERTTMLAAMSHDLRTPLTKIRLRGEFIEDDEQRARLFRDVDDLQAMADSALAFFRDDFKDEDATLFDFGVLLRTIADDYADQDRPVCYTGPERFPFSGRPLALRRACMNLVDNALKYGNLAELTLTYSSTQIEVGCADSGPGIPPHAFEKVFEPFYRLEQSRNRSTGGMGLGLTSTRAVILAHSGRIVLRNRAEGGLDVKITFPLA